MDTALVPVSPAVALPTRTASRLVAAFLEGRNPRTLDAYRRDLEDFRAFLNVPTSNDAARVLLASGQGAANETALRYRADLLARKLAPATVNRRLAAVRSLVKLARLLGVVPWTLDVGSGVVGAVAVQGGATFSWTLAHGGGNAGARRCTQAFLSSSRIQTCLGRSCFS